MSVRLSLPRSIHKFDPLQIQSTITKSFDTLTLLIDETAHPNLRSAHHRANTNTMAPDETVPYHWRLLTTTSQAPNEDRKSVV